MNRLEANRKILEKVWEVVERNPDWRFQQVLQNLGITQAHGPDRWYEESEETLAVVNGVLEKTIDV